MTKRYIEAYPTLADLPEGSSVVDGQVAWVENIEEMYYRKLHRWEKFGTAESVLEIMTFDSVKTVDFTDIPETYTAIATLITPARVAGEYFVGFSGTYSYSHPSESAFIRFRVNGSSWYESVSPKQSATENTQFTYQYPRYFDAGVNTIELQARKESANGTFNFKFLDLYFQRVK